MFSFLWKQTLKRFACLYYWLVEPTKDKFLDTSEAQPAFEILIESDWGINKFALFVSENGIPEYGRLTIPDLDDEKIREEFLPMIQAVKEHFLSILRITYHPDAVLFPRPIWTFVENLSSYTIGVELHRYTKINFDIDRTKRLLVGGFSYRKEIRLFIDGYDERIPLQYRYLSLYKIIELHYRKRGQWDDDGLQAPIGKYTPQFTSIGVLGKPISHIHALRDKCAHIKTGKSREIFGVTQLNHKAAVEVSKILPLMSDICIEIINEQANGDFVIGKRPFG